MVVAWIRRWPLEGRLALMRRRCFAVRPIPPASDERMTAEGLLTSWRGRPGVTVRSVATRPTVCTNDSTFFGNGYCGIDLLRRFHSPRADVSRPVPRRPPGGGRLRGKSAAPGAGAARRPSGSRDPQALAARWTAVRHREAAERTVLAAIAAGVPAVARGHIPRISHDERALPVRLMPALDQSQEPKQPAMIRAREGRWEK
jgi:hypothetical protein